MTLVRWTEQAADDLAAIREFLARDSPAYAHVIAERLYTSVGHLRGFPELGRMVPERADHDLASQAVPRTLTSPTTSSGIPSPLRSA